MHKSRALGAILREGHQDVLYDKDLSLILLKNTDILQKSEAENNSKFKNRMTIFLRLKKRKELSFLLILKI